VFLKSLSKVSIAYTEIPRFREVTGICIQFDVSRFLRNERTYGDGSTISHVLGLVPTRRNFQITLEFGHCTETRLPWDILSNVVLQTLDSSLAAFAKRTVRLKVMCLFMFPAGSLFRGGISTLAMWADVALPETSANAQVSIIIEKGMRDRVIPGRSSILGWDVL